MQFERPVSILRSLTVTCCKQYKWLKNIPKTTDSPRKHLRYAAR